MYLHRSAKHMHFCPQRELFMTGIARLLRAWNLPLTCSIGTWLLKVLGLQGARLRPVSVRTLWYMQELNSLERYLVTAWDPTASDPV